jgi:hypothetical protein
VIQPNPNDRESMIVGPLRSSISMLAQVTPLVSDTREGDNTLTGDSVSDTLPARCSGQSPGRIRNTRPSESSSLAIGTRKRSAVVMSMCSRSALS